MISAKRIKEIAKKAGADMCGVAPIERMKNAPPEMNPGLLWPNVKSIVGFVFRIPRGVQRGIEEGTQFYQYPSMAYGGINEILAPAVLYHVGKAIEDEGYEAFVYRNTGARGCVSDMDGSVGATLSPEEQIEVNENAKNSTAHHRSVEFTRATRPGENVPPDLQFQFRICAVACGLGEIGWSKMLLTPQYGPLQRVAFLFTDAEFDEYDPIYHGKPLCRKCGACVRECPGHCIPPIKGGKKCTASIGDYVMEWGDIDMWKCYAFYTHAGRYFNPFVPKEVWDENKDGALDLMEGKAEASEHEIMKVYTALQKYFPTWVGYNMAKCGGCIRACVSMLEKPGGCMHGRFKNPLRTRTKAWKMDR